MHLFLIQFIVSFRFFHSVYQVFLQFKKKTTYVSTLIKEPMLWLDGRNKGQ